MAHANEDDIVFAIESLGSHLDAIEKSMPTDRQATEIKQSLLRIEELLERLVEALSPDGPSP